MKRIHMERRQKIWLVILLIYIALVYCRIFQGKRFCTGGCCGTV